MESTRLKIIVQEQCAIIDALLGFVPKTIFQRSYQIPRFIFMSSAINVKIQFSDTVYHPSRKAANQDEFQHQINRIGPLKQWIADLMKSDTRNGNCHILESFFVKACLKTLKGSSILFDLKRPHARAKNRQKWFSISLANQSLGSLDCNILRDGSLEEVMTSGRWSENQGGFLRVFGSISTQ